MLSPSTFHLLSGVFLPCDVSISFLSPVILLSEQNGVIKWHIKVHQSIAKLNYMIYFFYRCQGRRMKFRTINWQSDASASLSMTQSRFTNRLIVETVRSEIVYNVDKRILTHTNSDVARQFSNSEHKIYDNAQDFCSRIDGCVCMWFIQDFTRFVWCLVFEILSSWLDRLRSFPLCQCQRDTLKFKKWSAALDGVVKS